MASSLSSIDTSVLNKTKITENKEVVSLPAEILSLIFSWLTIEEIARSACRVTRQWYFASSYSEEWKN